MLQRSNGCNRFSSPQFLVRRIHFIFKESFMSNFMTAEQVLAANKANVETLFGLTEKAFEAVE